MRRLLTGAALTLSVSSLPSMAMAAFVAPPGGDDGDGELVMEDEGTAPAADAKEPDINLNDTSFLDDASSSGKTDPLAEAAKPAAGGEEYDIDQDALDEQMISVVSWQPMLNVFKNEDGRKVHRWDIQPQVGISVNDPYVRHWSLGGEVNWWATNRLAIGVSGQYFIGQRTSNYYNQKRQQKLLLTANRFQWEASAAVLYEPFYGKFAVFNRYLLHWESYLQLGGGVIQSEILPRFETIHQPFKSINPQGNFAAGARFYLPNAQYMSINFGVRTWIFPDLYEPLERNAIPKNEQEEMLTDPANAKEKAGESKGTIAYNSIFFVGLSFYLPTKFQYSTSR